MGIKFSIWIFSRRFISSNNTLNIMKNLFGVIVGLSIYLVGCVFYVAFYSVILVAMFIIGIKIINWLF